VILAFCYAVQQGCCTLAHARQSNGACIPCCQLPLPPRLQRTSPPTPPPLPHEPTGFGSLDEALSKGRDQVEALARIHILPPVPVTRALWTHPFFSTCVRGAATHPCSTTQSSVSRRLLEGRTLDRPHHHHTHAHPLHLRTAQGAEAAHGAPGRQRLGRGAGRAAHRRRQGGDEGTAQQRVDLRGRHLRVQGLRAGHRHGAPAVTIDQ